MLKLALALTTSVLTATTVFAEGDLTPVVVDADGNGSFSFVEVQAAYSAVTEEVFKAADTDASGELSPVELQTSVEAGAFSV